MSHTVRSFAWAAGAVAVSCFGLAQAAEASTVTIATSPSFTGSGGGGEFAVTSIDNYVAPGIAAVNRFNNGDIPGLNSGNVFQTFCLEKNEEIQNGHTYDYTISTRAFHGGTGLLDGSGEGNNGDATGDPISAATAWLYTRFWNGTLLNIDDPTTVGIENASYNYTFGAGRASAATDLQQALYVLEGEADVSSLVGNSLTYYHAAIGAVSSGAWTGLGNVRVMNLTYTDANGLHFAQDVLIMVPLPPAVWAGFGLLSVIGVAGLIRRRRLHTLA